MKLIRKFFKKEPKVFYSCVIDDDPKFYWQGYIFVNSLVNLAKVDGKRIFVHMTAKNAEFEEFLSQKNVNIKYIEPWGDRKYCNKLQQLETQELQQADYLFFCDADIAIVNDLTVLVEDSKNSILGKIVDFDNPDISTLGKIYDIFKLKYPKRNRDTLNGKETFEGNFNGGLYGIPSKYLKQFALQWKQYAQEMLDSGTIKELLKEKINHVDQISFSLSLNRLKLPYKLLSWEFNCPTHIKDFDALNQKLGKDINVIHYHSNLSNIGLLNEVDSSLINKTINIINAMLQNNFNNKLFWKYHYKSFFAGRGKLSVQKIPNDIDNTILDKVLEENSINSDLLLESVLVSRNTFGWYTKHYPRLYEYPWLLEKVGKNLSGLKVADFGAGVTPLPIQLAHRGARVYTVDKHEVIRTLGNIRSANEWGFFDYSAVDKKIKSLNDSLSKDTFQNDFFDIWYSISVVEHMPAEIRRDIFKIMADTLKNGGEIYLTIDLVKDSEALWNMAEGKEVEDAKKHGTLDSFIVELEQLGFNINEKQIIRMPKDERVDIALISGILHKEKL